MPLLFSSYNKKSIFSTLVRKSIFTSSFGLQAILNNSAYRYKYEDYDYYADYF